MSHLLSLVEGAESQLNLKKFLHCCEAKIIFFENQKISNKDKLAQILRCIPVRFQSTVRSFFLPPDELGIKIYFGSSKFSILFITSSFGLYFF
ncbi:hypothetical protein BpHYR1_036657 [Brachionus plicatilis]|uniref:Uncharacterized protein n=1 Tax=Brachionus plicatilis TaxID=10195 RepID=A0A3M7SNC8_BRAPC|nr:hypothetical protein BpHYR1_036657 [Brachionus plicatilis]